MKKLLMGMALIVPMVLPAAVRASVGDMETSFRASLADFEAAWKMDSRAVAAFWVNDGTLISPVGQQAKGPAEIEKVIEADKAGVIQGGTMHFTLINLRPITAEVAFVDLQNDITGRQGPDGSLLPDLHLHVSAIATLKNNKWSWIDTRPYAFLLAPSAPATPAQ